MKHRPEDFALARERLAAGAILTRRDVCALTSLSLPSLRRRWIAGEFPPPSSLGGGRVGWPASVVRAWLDAFEASAAPTPRKTRRAA